MRPRRHRLLLACALLLAAAAPAACARRRPPAGRPGEVRAPAVESALPREDPAAPAWRDAPETLIALEPQDLVEPKLATPGVRELRVRALHDGRWVAFRLEWRDEARDALVGPGQPSDACAVQLPADPAADLTDPAMGLTRRPVHIAYWKAAWQETGDPVAALRPRMAIDHYPFQAAPPEARSALEAAYAPARAARNPVAARPAGAAVQDLVAEGPGTITAAPSQRSVGRGAWTDGVWTVTIGREVAPAGAAPVPVGPRTHVAFAVWDGGRGQVGARKMRSVWLPLVLEARP